MKFGSHHNEKTRVKMSLAKKGKHVSDETRKKMSLGHAGKPLSTQHRQALAEGKKGPKNPNWKGGRVRVNGYVRILCPDHPYAQHDGYVFQHRLVMETHLGRVLLPTEVVHHINGIGDDNRYENLMLFSNQSQHLKFENNIRIN